MTVCHRFAVAGAAMLLASCSAMAQGPASAGTTPAETKAEPAKPYVPLSSTTRQSGTFGGQAVDYSVTVAETVLKDDKDETPKAAIVTTAYVAEPRDPNRPVTFLFNGGPGSGSVWLQMGAFGPKRVAIPSRRQGRRRGALSAARQSRQPARRHRPRLHRSGWHRPVARHRHDRGQGLLGRDQGREIGRRRHPPLAQRQWPLEQPQVPRRRKLWHDALGRSRQRARGRL